MLLVIHNLPDSTRYSDVKTLIQTKCGLSEVILDNLVPEGPGLKKVTVGLADEGDAAILVRKINGLYMLGQQLYVEDVRKKKASEQPYRSSSKLIEESQSTSYNSVDPKYQTNQDQGMFRQSYQAQQPTQSQMVTDQMSLMMNYGMGMGGMMYMPTITPAVGAIAASNMPVANAFMGYGTQAPQGVAAPLGEPYAAARNYNAPSNWNASNSQANRPSRDVERSPERFRNRPGRSSPDRGWSSSQQSPAKSRWDITAQELTQRSPPSSWRMQQSETSQFAQTNRAMDSENSRGLEMPKGNKDFRRYFDAPQDDRAEGRGGSFLPKPAFIDMSNSQVNSSQRRQGYDRSSPQRFRQNQGQNAQRPSYDQGRNAPRPVFDQGRNAPRPAFDQGKSKPRPAFDQGRNAPRPAFNQSRNAPRAAFDQGRNASRPSYDQGKNAVRSGSGQGIATSRPSYSEGQNMSRPPRPETRRQQEQPRGAKRAPEPLLRHQENPPKRFASSQPQGFGKAVPTATPRSFPPRSNDIERPRPHANTRDMQNMSPEMKKMLNKDVTFRGQAASHLGREVVTNLDLKLTRNDPVFRQLKSNLRDRINTLFPDKLTTDWNEIVLVYRKKWHPASDQKLYRNVLFQVKQMKASGLFNEKEGQMVTDADEIAKAKLPGVEPKPHEFVKPFPKKPSKPALNQQSKPGENKVGANKAGPSKGPKKPAPKPVPNKKDGPKETKPIPPDNQSNKIVPNVDKETRRQTKKQLLEEYTNENLYQLPPAEQKALDSEADVLCDIFMGECQEPDKENEKRVCEIISDNAADVFRKVVRLHVTKRLLNIVTGLQARVMFSGPPPKPASMDKFFAKHGVTAVHKTKNRHPLYLISCNSYETIDRLCNMRNATVDGVPVQIKPFQVTGPPPKLTKNAIARQRNTRIQNQIDDEVDTLLTPQSYDDDVEVSNFDDNEHSATDNKDVKAEIKEIPKKEKVDTEVKKNDTTGGKSEDNAVKSEATGVKSQAGNSIKKKDNKNTKETSETKDTNTNANVEDKAAENSKKDNNEEDWPVGEIEIDQDWPVPQEEAVDWNDDDLTNDGAANGAEVGDASVDVDDDDVDEDELEDY